MNNVLWSAVLILSLICIAWLLNNKREQESVYVQNVSALNDTVAIWENRYGSLVAEKTAFVLKERDLLASIKKLNVEKLDIQKQLKKFKEAKTVIITKTRFKLDTINIYIDSSGLFQRRNPHYFIEGRVGDSVNLHTVQFFNSQSIIFGKKSQGWQKPTLVTAQITNSNPYLRVEDVQSFTTSIPKKRFHVGFQTGVGVSTSLQPFVYIGFGLSYSLFSF